MKLSSPIFVLKSQARKLKRHQSISMVGALNQIAKREGYGSWSLLKLKHLDSLPYNYNEVLDYFNGGDLVLIGARPHTGKTSFTIGLFVQAIQKKLSMNYFFTLSEVKRDIVGRMEMYDNNIDRYVDFFTLNYSNEINADYIIKSTKKDIGSGSLIIIDYLQLLDEKRVNPPLQEQVEKLKRYAKEQGCIIVFISQLAREVENRNDKKPSIQDVRLPNPLDLKLMNKVILLFRERNDSHEGEVLLCRPKEHCFSILFDKGKVIYT